MIELFAVPLVKDILTWATLGALAYLVKKAGDTVKHFKSIEDHMQLMERSNKSLMRSDLVKRYQFWRDNGHWVSDGNLEEWLADYEVYEQLHGTNGYLKKALEEVTDMPNGPEGKHEQV